MSEELLIYNDEPAEEDKFGRENLVKSFVKISTISDTPLVIGILGDWGTGKTSLMKLVMKDMKKSNKQIIPVWFNAYKHQYNESPAIAMLQKLVIDTGKLKLIRTGQVKKLFSVISLAMGSSIFNKSTGINVNDIQKLGEQYEKENFKKRDARIKLDEHLKKLISKLTKDKNKNKRIVFFIDDLDRCNSENALNFLEDIKIHLNQKNCVYFISLDSESLSMALKKRYGEDLHRNEQYIDKIIQLPFHIPAIPKKSLECYINEMLLDNELTDCTDVIIKSLNNNPREIKRYINCLILNYNLAKSSSKNFDYKILNCFILLQYRYNMAYIVISNNLECLLDDEQRDELIDRQISNDIKDNEKFQILIDNLVEILKQNGVEDKDYLDKYIYFMSSSLIAEDNVLESTRKYDFIVDPVLSHISGIDFSEYKSKILGLNETVIEPLTLDFNDDGFISPKLNNSVSEEEIDLEESDDQIERGSYEKSGKIQFKFFYKENNEPLVQKYFSLRMKAFFDQWGLKYFSDSEDEYDHNAHILIAHNSKICIAGARLIIREPNSDTLLPIETKDFRLMESLPQLNLENKKYCEISRLAIVREYRNGKVTEEMLSKLAKKAKELQCDYIFILSTIIVSRVTRIVLRRLGYEVNYHSEVPIPELPTYEGHEMRLISVSLINDV